MNYSDETARDIVKDLRSTNQFLARFILRKLDFHLPFLKKVLAAVSSKTKELIRHGDVEVVSAESLMKDGKAREVVSLTDENFQRIKKHLAKANVKIAVLGSYAKDGVKQHEVMFQAKNKSVFESALRQTIAELEKEGQLDEIDKPSIHEKIAKFKSDIAKEDKLKTKEKNLRQEICGR